MSSEAVGYVFRHSPYRGAAFLVHLAIADSVNDQHFNEFWMAQGRLAEKARVSRASAQRALDLLAEDGWVEALDTDRAAAKRAGRPARYRFVFVEAEVQYESRRVPHHEAPPAAGVPHHEAPGASPRSTGVPHHEALTQEGTQEEPKSSLAELVREVFAYWQETTGHPRAVLDDKRRKRIEWALKNYALVDVRSAIRGVTRSEFNMGKNPERKVYDDVTLIFRDAEHAERFMGFDAGPARQESKFDQMSRRAG